MSEVVVYEKSDLQINSSDIQNLGEHLERIKEFVKGTLREGIDSDYAIIPGTKKNSLLKPGAEKLMRLFGLSSRVELVSKEVDRYENYAEFTYKAYITHIKTGQMIAECEAMANSWETKYKETRQGKPIPVSNILNTLMKMAQKRAIVGATILATGASDFFTQDEDEIAFQREQRQASKNADDGRFDEGSVNDPGEFVVGVGKFKGKKIKDIDKKELSGYVGYIVEQNPNIDGKLKDFVVNAREYLR